MWRPEPSGVLELARTAGLSLGSAESLTGGGVSALLTSVAGASDVWRGSIVAYNAEVKASVLRVPLSVLEVAGAVSADTALAMAHGGRAVLGADLVVSTTGVAGPDPHRGQSIGRVVVAVAGPGLAFARSFDFEGDRADVVDQSVDAALALLFEALGGQMPGGRGFGEQV